MVAGLTITGCGGSADVKYKSVVRQVFNLSCQPVQLTFRQVLDEMQRANITPRASSCAYDGLLRPGICGTSVGFLHVIDIPGYQTGDATNLGYLPVETFPQLIPLDCPPQ